jgi:hypothetical protein
LRADCVFYEPLLTSAAKPRPAATVGCRRRLWHKGWSALQGSWLMGLSVEENVLRCIRKFGARITHPVALRQLKWQSPYRPLRGRCSPRPSESAETAKDK